MIIYKITNKINNKIYIGSTSNFEERKKVHLRTLNNGTHHNIYLTRAVSKYGVDAFEFGVLEDSESNQFEREQFWIDSLRPEYNIGPVGGGDNLTNHPLRDEIIAKMTKTVKANMEALGPEGRSAKYGKLGEDNSNWRGGISRSFCSCGKEKALTAKVCGSCRDRTGENNPFFGKTHSAETRKKISEAAKGRVPSNTRAVMVEGTEYPSVTAAAKAYGVVPGTMVYRLKSCSPKWSKFYYKTSEMSNDYPLGE